MGYLVSGLKRKLAAVTAVGVLGASAAVFADLDRTAIKPDKNIPPVNTLEEEKLETVHAAQQMGDAEVTVNAVQTTTEAETPKETEPVQTTVKKTETEPELTEAPETTVTEEEEDYYEEPSGIIEVTFDPPADNSYADDDTEDDWIDGYTEDQITDRDLVGWVMFPKVVEDFYKKRKEYGYITRLGSHVFFHGQAVGETNKVNIEDGKTLVIKYLGKGDLDNDGYRTVHFELNGSLRDVKVRDNTASEHVVNIEMADPNDKSQVGASIPGAVSKINVKVGDVVKENDILAVVEAMKMETSVTARMAGTIEEVLVKPNDTVKAGQLLIRIKS